MEYSRSGEEKEKTVERLVNGRKREEWWIYSRKRIVEVIGSMIQSPDTPEG